MASAFARAHMVVGKTKGLSMKMFPAVLAAAATAMLLPAGAAQARMRHHHHYHRVAGARFFAVYPPGPGAFGPYGAPYGHPSQEPLGSGLYNPYLDYAGPGSIVLNRTEQARREPGLTQELAPDAKETATGGPVGGVPGFDGT